MSLLEIGLFNGFMDLKGWLQVSLGQVCVQPATNLLESSGGSSNLPLTSEGVRLE